jgi:hypothetical protein
MDTTIGESEASQTLCRPNNRVVPIAAQPHVRIFSRCGCAAQDGVGGGHTNFPATHGSTCGYRGQGNAGPFLNDFSPSDTSIRAPQRVLCSQWIAPSLTDFASRLERVRTGLRVVSPHGQNPFAKRSYGDHLDVWVREFRICLIVLHSYIPIDHYC